MELNPESIEAMQFLGRRASEHFDAADPGDFISGGTLVEIAGCDNPTVWIDRADYSLAIEHSGVDAAGVINIELVAIVGLHGGYWWWSAMGPKRGGVVPEETRGDAKRAVHRSYARVVGEAS